MRAAVTGVLAKDTLVMEKFPTLDSAPENHLIVSPKWVASMYEEMEKIFKEKLGSDRTVGGASLTSTLWCISGVIDAGATRPLGKERPPPKSRAKKTDATASKSENGGTDLTGGGEAHRTDVPSNSKKPSKASADSLAKGGTAARPEPSTRKRQTKKKTKGNADALQEKEGEDEQEEEEASENTSTKLKQMQSTSAVPHRRPSRAAAQAASARVAEMAVDSLAFQAEQAMQATTTRKRVRNGDPMPSEPVHPTTSPVSNEI